MRTRMLLVVAVAAVLLSSCQWVQHRGNAALTGHQKGETTIDVGNVSTLVERWRGSAGGPYEAPTVAGSRVHTTGGTWAVDGGPGCSATPVTCPPSTRLPTAFANPLASATLAHDFSLVLPSAGSTVGLSAFDAAGIAGCGGSPVTCQPRWTTSTDPYPTSTTGHHAHLVQGVGAPTVAGSVVYAANVTDAGPRLYAFDATGTQGCSGTPTVCRPLWATDEGAFPASVAVSGGRVFAVHYQPYGPGPVSELRVYDAAGVAGCSGTPKVCQPLWTADLGEDAGSLPGWTSPVVDGVVYLIVQAGIFAFDATGASGCAGTPTVCQPLWTAGLPGSFDEAELRYPAVADGRLFVPDVDGTWSFDAAGVTGCSGTPTRCEPLALFDTGDGATSATVANGVVYVGGNNGLFAFDAAALTNCAGPFTVCSPIWHALPDTHASAPAVVNGRIHVASGGNLVTFGLP